MQLTELQIANQKLRNQMEVAMGSYSRVYGEMTFDSTEHYQSIVDTVKEFVGLGTGDHGNRVHLGIMEEEDGFIFTPGDACYMLPNLCFSPILSRFESLGNSHYNVHNVLKRILNSSRDSQEIHGYSILTCTDGEHTGWLELHGNAGNSLRKKQGPSGGNKALFTADFVKSNAGRAAFFTTAKAYNDYITGQYKGPLPSELPLGYKNYEETETKYPEYSKYNSGIYNSGILEDLSEEFAEEAEEVGEWYAKNTETDYITPEYQRLIDKWQAS